MDEVRAAVCECRVAQTCEKTCARDTERWLEEMFRERLSIGRTKRRVFDPMPCIRPIGPRREFPQCSETVGHEEEPHPTGCVGEATLDDGARGRLW